MFIILLRFTGPPVPITAGVHSTPQNVHMFIICEGGRDSQREGLVEHRVVRGLVLLRKARVPPVAQLQVRVDGGGEPRAGLAQALRAQYPDGDDARGLVQTLARLHPRRLELLRGD
eukprot:7531928-Pyramimonas_sp.AAC.1